MLNRYLLPGFLAALWLGAGSVSSANATTVTVVEVKVVSTTFGFLGDEVFLATPNGGRSPAGAVNAVSIDAGETWSPQATFNADGPLTVQLLEQDLLGSDDLVGQFTVEPARPGGRYVYRMEGGGAVYDIVFDVAASSNDGDIGRDTSSPAGTERIWGSAGSGIAVTAFDCADEECAGDLGVVVVCQGAGLPLRMEVPWLATDGGVEGDRGPLTINIEGQRFTYTATKGPDGMVGHVPGFQLYHDDPLIEAMQAGHAMELGFEGQSTSIGLTSSRAALDRVKAECPADAGSNEAYWFSASGRDPATGAQTATLTLGIPETDAVGFYAECPARGNGNVTINLIGFGDPVRGANVNVTLTAGGRDYRYQGEGFIESSEWSGVKAKTNIDDPVWQAIANSESRLTYGVDGIGSRLASERGASVAVPSFVNQCRQLSRPESDKKAFRPVGGVQPVQPTQRNGGQTTNPGIQPVQPGSGGIQPVQPPEREGAMPRRSGSGGIQPVQPGSDGIQPVTPNVNRPARQDTAGYVGGSNGSASFRYVCDRNWVFDVTRTANGIILKTNGYPDATLITQAPRNGANVFSDGTTTVVASGNSFQLTSGDLQLNCQVQ